MTASGLHNFAINEVCNELMPICFEGEDVSPQNNILYHCGKRKTYQLNVHTKALVNCSIDEKCLLLCAQINISDVIWEMYQGVCVNCKYRRLNSQITHMHTHKDFRFEFLLPFQLHPQNLPRTFLHLQTFIKALFSMFCGTHWLVNNAFRFNCSCGLKSFRSQHHLTSVFPNSHINACI